MLKILIKFFRFGKEQNRLFYQSVGISVLHAVFEALRIPAISIVLTALLQKNVSIKTAFLSFGIMLISLVGSTITKAVSSMKQTVGGYTMATNKRIEIAERIKYMPMGFFNTNSLGEIASTITNVAENLQDLATRVIMLTIQGMISTIIIICGISFYDVRIGVLLVIGACTFFFINSLMQKKSQQISLKKTISDTKLVSSVLEYVQGIAVVRSYNLDTLANQQVDLAIRENEQVNTAMEYTFIPYVCLQSLVLKLFGVLTIFCSIYLYLANSLLLSFCLVFIVSSFLVFSHLESLGSYSFLMRMLDMSMDKINQIFDIPVMDIDGEAITPTSTDIVLTNVSFCYKNQQTINQVTCNIPQGSTTAIVGPSGSGKTTLCHLITRFWDVDEGSITLGGIDIRKYTLDSLLSQFSMVFQHVYLFNDTIMNNIRFGKPEASRNEIENAAKKACCHDFILSLPDGYETIVGEGGATISGGEKQRISIARALLKDAPIIILDEATANIDPENEELLQKAISELTLGKTVIMIAHRLKTVEKANQIIVLDHGQIKQLGTHNELWKEKGIYRDFVELKKQSIGWKLGKQNM